MDDATARKIQGKAKKLAYQWGRPEIAQDFAQHAVICALRWPTMELEHAFINFLRQEYGSSRTGSGRTRQMATARAIRLDSPVDDSDGGSSLHHELVGDPKPDPRHLESPRDFSYLFQGEPKRPGKRGRSDRWAVLAQVYRLRFEEELSPKEIGDIVGMTEGNARMALRTIEQRIMREAGLEEVKEKLAEDPGITEIEIDWIRL